MKIPLLSSSSEDIGVGLNGCDFCVTKCMSQSIKIHINQKEWRQATKPLQTFKNS
jgi:hypothetical protein